MSEMNSPEWLRQPATWFTPDKTRLRPDHGVPPTHDIYIANEITNVWMGLRQIRQDKIDPSVPAGVQQTHPLCGRRCSGQWLIKGENGLCLKGTKTLMCRDDIT